MKEGGGKTSTCISSNNTNLNRICQPMVGSIVCCDYDKIGHHRRGFLKPTNKNDKQITTESIDESVKIFDHIQIVLIFFVYHYPLSLDEWLLDSFFPFMLNQIRTGLLLASAQI